MQIDVYKDTKIFVVCPARFATGGPELLHQLVYKMRKLGYNAAMYYYPTGLDDPIHPFYKHYENPYASEIEDTYDNILVVPEVRTDMIYLYKNIREIIWWLGVEPFPRYPLSLKKLSGWKRLIKNFLKDLSDPHWCYNFENIEKLQHLVQSENARSYLLSKGVGQNKIDRLSDYINPVFISEQLSNKAVRKEDIVVFNPLKGYEFTEKIMKRSKGIKFVPIMNMSPKEVAELLLRAKVYIDFGTHSGKDRLPREAAISQCCVIVRKTGTARFLEDMPLPEEFKIDTEKVAIKEVAEKIRYTLENYDNEIQKFREYRDFIIQEEKNFEEDIKRIFRIAE